LNETQKSNVRRDHYKRRFAKESGFYVLYVWEQDLKNFSGSVRLTLQTYIERANEKAADFELLRRSRLQLSGDGAE
jgi:G:T-mismatch repair DNA endonuclease (very short patch repair protein)